MRIDRKDSERLEAGLQRKDQQIHNAIASLKLEIADKGVEFELIDDISDEDKAILRDLGVAYTGTVGDLMELRNRLKRLEAERAAIRAMRDAIRAAATY